MATKWKAKGDYCETCNCQSRCPGIFLSPLTEGTCTVLVGWHIESGKFADTSLDGLNVAAFFHRPDPCIRGTGTPPCIWIRAPQLSRPMLFSRFSRDRKAGFRPHFI